MSSRGRWIPSVAAVAVSILAWQTPATAQDAPVAAEEPILLTSCGQSPGPTMVRLFLNRLGLDHQLLEQATAQDLVDAQNGGNPFHSVIILTGASLKGMGAAGTSMREELIRTEALIQEARSQGLTIIGAHVEGMDRRAQGASAGDNSDEQSIDAVMPLADVMVVRADGNEDRRFTFISEEKGIPLVLFEKNMEMGDAFGSLFNK